MTHSTETTIEVAYATDLECPACSSKIPVMVDVEVKSDRVSYTGSSGFHAPNFSVHLNTKIKKFKIHHECEFKEKKR